MPMFETPKPKQFRYKPRFYDPEKERWEALKQKYADKKMLERLDGSECGVRSSDLMDAPASSEPRVHNSELDKDLEYFQRRVRELDRQKSSRLTWKDMFRRREMPKFNYQPRFSSEFGVVGRADGTPRSAELKDAPVNSELRGVPSALPTTPSSELADFRRRGIKIKRRFGNDDPDDNTLKPVPAGRIMLYALLVVMLLYWIIN